MNYLIFFNQRLFVSMSVRQFLSLAYAIIVFSVCCAYEIIKKKFLFATYYASINHQSLFLKPSANHIQYFQ